MIRKSLLAILALVIIGYFVFRPYNYQNILDKSELKNKTFNGKVVEIQSPQNNLKAYLFEDKSNPIISINFLFKSAGWAGNQQANFLEALLLDGAGDLDAQAFKEELENNAISLSFSANADDFVGSILTTKENLPKAIDLFKKAFYEPRFEAAYLEKTKQVLQLGLKKQKEHPANVLGLEFNQKLYNGHPYGNNPIGTTKLIETTTSTDLRFLMQKSFAKNNVIISFAGDIDSSRAKLVIDDMFSQLASKNKLDMIQKVAIKPIAPDWIIKSTPQNITLFAGPGVSRNDMDFYPLYIANYIFGGSGLSSRLSQVLREKSGLTYSVWTSLILKDASPIVLGGFSSSSSAHQKAFGLLEQEMLKFATKGASKKELLQAQSYLVSSHNLRFASIEGISELLLYMQKEQLGIDFLEKRNHYVSSVSLEAVNEAAKKYYTFDKMQKMTIGDKNDI